MSADLASRLRALAHDYHEGRLTLAAYRKLRAPLLDSLELPGAWVADDTTVTRPRGARPLGSAGQSAQADSARKSAGSRARLLAAAGLVGVLLVAGIVIWSLRDSRPDADPLPAEAGGAGVASRSVQVHAVIAPFMERGDWSDRRVAALNAALLELGTDQIAAAANEPWFGQFVQSLRRRLKEQQALAMRPLAPDNSPLAALAVTVGLDLESPDAAIRIPQIEAPRQEAPQRQAPVRKPEQVLQAESREQPPASASEQPQAQERVTTAAAPAAEASVREASATEQAAAPASAQSSTTCRLELIGSRRPLCHDVLPSGEEGPQLALIPAGEFDMGSTESASEQPVHRVKIARPFAISVHEVSQAEFGLFCKHTGRTCPPQPWSGDDYPVVNVSWQDASDYAEWLSEVTQRRYRLPSEAEWEYAARAGQTGLYPSGDALSPTDAHFSMLGRQERPARRSQKFNPNRFRLFHTVGNVREWVQDGWRESFATETVATGLRVVRGGSYADGAQRLRLSIREGLPAGTRDALTGFRVVRELP